jgi:hypothetical protein
MDRGWKSGASATPPVHTDLTAGNYPTAGNPGSGTPATKPGPYWYHMITEELLAVIVGSGLTPDKSVLTQLRDAIGTVEQTITATGTQHDVSLTSKRTFLRCNSAAALVITGFSVAGAAPKGGDRVTVHNIGAFSVRVANQDAGSAAANRAIHPSVQGQIIGTNGSIEYIYDDTSDRWRMVRVEPGAPISVGFNAGDFTGSGGMTVTVEAADLATFTFRQTGKTVRICVDFGSFTVGGTPSTHVQVLLPNGFVSSVEQRNAAHVRVNAVFENGYMHIAGAASTQMLIGRSAANSWVASTNNNDARGTFDVEVN